MSEIPMSSADMVRQLAAALQTAYPYVKDAKQLPYVGGSRAREAADSAVEVIDSALGDFRTWERRKERDIRVQLLQLRMEDMASALVEAMVRCRYDIAVPAEPSERIQGAGWVDDARTLVARYAQADQVRAVDIPKMSLTLSNAAQDCGFDLDNAPNPREPAWVHVARQAHERRKERFTADLHPMPPLAAIEYEVSELVRETSDPEEVREHQIAEYEQFKAENKLKLGSADQHLFDSSLTLEQLVYVRDFVERWEQNEHFARELSPHRPG
ncbi:hypothetical protein [Xanthomonas arboricola]|uniref:Uncharacterized protein n=1 Tax=Xanthomonas arboricola TaxID=56448 RepID=A0AB73H1Q3_9XANT|nr:hypothetical protein [Xanthomonas arboricola]MBB5672320.1 hypothetical protein [Xanthomonas arboricola]